MGYAWGLLAQAPSNSKIIQYYYNIGRFMVFDHEIMVIISLLQSSTKTMGSVEFSLDPKRKSQEQTCASNGQVRGL